MKEKWIPSGGTKKSNKFTRAADKAASRIEKGFAYVRKHKAARGSMKVGAHIANMPYHTFRKRYLYGDAGPTFHGPPPALGRDADNALLAHVLACAEVAMCLPVMLVCTLAQELAAKLHIKTTCVFGAKWFAGFRKRHPGITLRQPQLIESFRVMAVSSVNMTHYFNVLGGAIKDVPPEKIWNMDESGISLRNMRTKVVAKTGQKNVNIIYQGDHKHVTFVGCVSATGAHITPMLIYKGKNKNAKNMAGYPEAIQAMNVDSGFIDNHIWLEWVQLFIKETGGNCVLITDHHSTRAYLPAILALREANVKLVVLQPHTTHVCQPCDVSVFRSFKGHIRTEVARRRGLGMYIDVPEISGLCKLGWDKAMKKTVDKDTGKETSPAIRGFEKTGIYPFNPSKISPDMCKIADDLLEKARTLREQEEAKEEAEDEGLPMPKAKGTKRAREDDEDEQIEDVVEELQGEARAAVISSHLVTPAPIALRLKKATSAISRRQMAEEMTSDTTAGKLLDKFEAKEAESAAKEERAAARIAKKAAKAAAPSKPKKIKKAKLSGLLSPLLASSSSSTFSSSASSSSASAAALFTPLIATGAGGVIELGGGGSDFQAAMQAQASV